MEPSFSLAAASQSHLSGKRGVEWSGEVQENNHERKCNRCAQLLLSLGNTDKSVVPRLQRRQSWLIEEVSLGI